MSQQNEQAYTGKFESAPRPQGNRKRLFVLLILILVLTRLVATGLKALSIAEYYIGGGRTLIYGDIKRVAFGDSLKSGEGDDARSIPILNQDDPVPSGESEYVIQRDDGRTLEYHGHTYALNEDLVTVLFLGIERPRPS